MIIMAKRYFILLIISILSTTYCTSQNTGIESAGRKIAQSLYLIDNLYVDTVNISDITDKTISTMLSNLDPHSSYIPASEVKSMNEGLQGNFEGIGISYAFIKDTVTVNQTISGCPAEKVGMLPGDKIIAVDGKPVAGVKIKNIEVHKLLRGERGTMVEVTVHRHGSSEPITFNIKRDKIPINSIDAAFWIDNEIAYIKINSFSFTTTEEFSKAMKELESKHKIKSLIIDLQSNGGGVMSAATNLVDQFIPSNRLIVYTQGEHLKRIDEKSTIGAKREDIELVILTDEYSASASEIVSGAFQDWDRATIIGRRTFGKGLVQRPFNLFDGSEIRLTIARYYTPSGRNIQKPYTEGSENYFKDIETRYKHGEFVHSDSINFPDSLKYSTLVKKRTVYGGGGIFPDIFVPLDTTKYTKYYRNIVAKGVFNTTVSGYIDQNRNQLLKQYSTFEKFNSSYETPQSLIDTILSNAKKEKIENKGAEKENRQTRDMIKLHAKAVVAQSIYKPSCYYEVVQQENDALQEGVKYLKRKR